MRSFIKGGLILLGLLGILALVRLAPAKKTALSPLEANLYFTCDIRGRLVPCGCFLGQFGGMTRLKTVLDSQADPTAIRVDIGDAIKDAEDYSRIQYRYLLEAFAGLGYDALNLGHREAQLSARQLRELKQQSPVTLLSANLIDRATGTPLFDGYKIIRRGNFRIALVGVMDPRLPAENLGDGLAVEKLDVTLSRLLPTLQSTADIIVLLAFTDEATLAELARDFSELDVILGGKVSQPSQKLTRENRSLILYVTNESRALGLLRARLTGRSQLQAVGYEIQLMHDKIPQHPAVQKLAQVYRQEIRGATLDLDNPSRLGENMVPGVKAAAAFVGSDRCETCHPTATKTWQKSSHARAYASLLRQEADADPNCIGCHTIGFGTPTGYQRAWAGKKLVDVGCESCHGPGSLHAQQRESGSAATFKFRPLAAGDCQRCHYGEFSRPFDWTVFWPPIAHGREPGSTAQSP